MSNKDQDKGFPEKLLKKLPTGVAEDFEKLNELELNEISSRLNVTKKEVLEMDSRLSQADKSLNSHVSESDENSEERSINIGKRISQKFGLITLVTYTNPEDPSPYYDLIFQKGLTYLADDMNSNLADNDIEKVKILKQINLPLYQFDEFGNLLT